MDTIILSIFAIIILLYSYKEGLGYISEPSAGFFGFIVGIILFITSILLGLSNFMKATKQHSKLGGRGLLSFCKVIGAMIAYGILLERFGILLTTFVTSLLLFARKDDLTSFRWPLLTVITTIGVYFVFVIFLKCHFPQGPIERILFNK